MFKFRPNGRARPSTRCNGYFGEPLTAAVRIKCPRERNDTYGDSVQSYRADSRGFRHQRSCRAEWSRTLEVTRDQGPHRECAGPWVLRITVPPSGVSLSCALNHAVIFGVSVRYLREIVVVPEETGEPTPQTVHKHMQHDTIWWSRQTGDKC